MPHLPSPSPLHPSAIYCLLPTLAHLGSSCAFCVSLLFQFSLRFVPFHFVSVRLCFVLFCFVLLCFGHPMPLPWQRVKLCQRTGHTKSLSRLVECRRRNAGVGWGNGAMRRRVGLRLQPLFHTIQGNYMILFTAR